VCQYRVSTCVSQFLIEAQSGAIEAPNPKSQTNPNIQISQELDRMRCVLVIRIWGTARHFFFGVERVVLNALANERGFAAGYLRLRRLLPSSSEKPIHL
jgi:hypothetical protein